MKVLAINSSPRTQGESRSERLLKHLVNGMENAKAEVEIVNLREYEVKFCQGCYTCWTKTPGRCRLKDDMSRILFPKWQEADIVIYSSPLYYRGFVAQLQAVVERTLPSYKPFVISDGERSHHPARIKIPDFVILSVAGFPDMKEFDLLSDWSKTNFDGEASKLLAEIYRPGSQALTQKQNESVAEEIFETVRQAGFEIITNRKVTDETMAKITQPLQDKEDFIKTSNLYWQSCIDEEVIPKQFEKKERSPRPKTVEDMMVLLPMGINKKEAEKTDATVQFSFESEKHENFFLDLKAGKVKALKGTSEQPSLTILTPFKLWSDIMTGLSDGTQKFMEGAYKIEGDGDLLIKLFA